MDIELYETDFPGMYVTEDGYLVDEDGNLYDGNGDLIEEEAVVLNEVNLTNAARKLYARGAAKSAASKATGSIAGKVEGIGFKIGKKGYNTQYAVNSINHPKVSKAITNIGQKMHNVGTKVLNKGGFIEKAGLKMADSAKRDIRVADKIIKHKKYMKAAKKVGIIK